MRSFLALSVEMFSQFAARNFTALCAGERGEDADLLGNCVRGQTVPKRLVQIIHAQIAIFNEGDGRRDLMFARIGLILKGCGFDDPVIGAESQLNLVKLNPISARFDLSVRAPDIFQNAVRIAPHMVTSAQISPAAPSATGSLVSSTMMPFELQVMTPMGMTSMANSCPGAMA